MGLFSFLTRKYTVDDLKEHAEMQTDADKEYYENLGRSKADKDKETDENIAENDVQCVANIAAAKKRKFEAEHKFDIPHHDD